MDLNRLWMGIPLVVVGAALVASVLTGKTVNPARGTDPLIVNRSDHPRRYWGSVVGLGVVLVVWSWLTFKVITMPT